MFQFLCWYLKEKYPISLVHSSIINVSLGPTSSNTYKRQLAYAVSSVAWSLANKLNRFHLVYKVYRDNREENLRGRASIDSEKLETSKVEECFLFERTQDKKRLYFQLFTWLDVILNNHKHSSRSADTKREQCSLTHVNSCCDFL